MDIVAFAIWKFKNIEGLLKGMNSFDVTTTKYIDPDNGSTSWIRYNYHAETASIERVTYKRSSIWSISADVPVTTIFECRFDELPRKLLDLGMYDELPVGKRHSLAGPGIQQ